MQPLDNFHYELPEDRIAKFPLENRDESKLLFFDQGKISHQNFKDSIQLVPADSLLFFNNTKVIAARLHFFKETGARIEVFLTDPVTPHNDFQLVLKSKKTCTWKCIIGNVKKWKDETLALQLPSGNGTIKLSANLIDREKGLVKFDWSGDSTFLDVVEEIGKVPLPPYLNREAEAGDKQRYQTVFSKLEGAVAAPTAGLHFTAEIIGAFQKKGIRTDYLTLHVSAGTFRPIKETDYKKHAMHNEKIMVSRQNLENILNSNGKVIAVGTTALRTLESVYWYGMKLIENEKSLFHIEQDYPYSNQNPPTKQVAISAVLKKMQNEKLETLIGETEIFIYPGYRFKICSGLFTNFHQPASTLVLLVAAFVGNYWREIYNQALANDYRFLSYGDTSLLLVEN